MNWGKRVGGDGVKQKPAAGQRVELLGHRSDLLECFSAGEQRGGRLLQPRAHL